jgi:5-methylcytosine-specific restriction protein A
MTWDRASRRRSELPPDWPIIQRDVLERDGHRCQIRGPRCTGYATEADHIGDKHNHTRTNCRAACHTCHSARTAAQGHQAARTARLTAQHPREPHPGLI